jgi:nucleotide-binding universal stress UspA family protein
VHTAAQPIVVAFDGSAEARAALAAAAGLFAGRRLLVVSVWEPGLAYAMTAPRSDLATYSVPSLEEVTTVDEAQRHQATDTAAEGAQILQDLGATGEPLPIADSGDVAGTLLEVAEAHDAGALVVGSRGLGAVKARLKGSVSTRVLHEADRPVLVVHGDRPA